jgi:hypothetical protein
MISDKLKEIEYRILELHEIGLSVLEISRKLSKKYSCRVVAGIIAKNEMTIKNGYVIVPSKINYPFKIIRDYE